MTWDEQEHANACANTVIRAKVRARIDILTRRLDNLTHPTDRVPLSNQINALEWVLQEIGKL
jgi:hypothetical protein